MSPTSDSCLRLVVAALCVTVATSIARGQVFQYDFEGNSGSFFGSSLNRVGDIDKDGADDFIVGAPEDGTNSQGSAVVYSGASGAILTLLKGSANSFLGWSVDGRLDLDGDGYNDILVGETGDSSVLAYSPHLATKLYKISGPAGSNFGNAVRSLESDLDGDGVDDFIVGAWTVDSAYVCSGATGSKLYAKTGQSGSLFGFAVSRAGDIDGDHVCDFLIASPNYTDSSLNVVGRVSAFSGATGTKIWSCDGTTYGAQFGTSVAEPGDLDGDGVADCIVGAPADIGPSGYKTGAVSVISGTTGTVVQKIGGDAATDAFGYDVRGVSGDIDGDGVRDYIVGAPNGLNGQGYARTISGAAGTVLHTYVEQTRDPSGVYSFYGSSVAGGDFNGDGLPDVLIGDSLFNHFQGLIEVFDAAKAAWSNYGAGWPGKQGVPSLTATGNPVIGQSIGITIGNSAGVSTSCILVLGLSQASIPTGKDGTLLVAPALFLPLSLPAGSLTLNGNIPNDPSLAAVNAYLQALEVDAGASKGVSFTAGLDLFFGYN